MDLTILIPALNEEETISGIVSVANKIKNSNKGTFEVEVLVSDNNSSDSTLSIAQKMGARTTTCEIRGYGANILHGIYKSNSKYVLFADADMSYDLEEGVDLYKKAIEKNTDIVIGCRFSKKMQKGSMPFLHKFVGTPILTKIVNTIYGSRYKDINSGMRVIKKDIFENYKFISTGMEFASEMLVLAAVNNNSVAEYPVSYYKDKRNRSPHLNTWFDGFRHFIIIFAYSYSTFKKIGVVLTLFALFPFTILLFYPLKIGGVVFDYHVMFFLTSFINLTNLLFTLGLVSEMLAKRNDSYNKNISILFKLICLSLALSLILFGWVFAEWIFVGGPMFEVRKLIFAVNLLNMFAQYLVAAIYIKVIELIHKK